MLCILVEEFRLQRGDELRDILAQLVRGRGGHAGLARCDDGARLAREHDRGALRGHLVLSHS